MAYGDKWKPGKRRKSFAVHNMTPWIHLGGNRYSYGKIGTWSPGAVRDMNARNGVGGGIRRRREALIFEKRRIDAENKGLLGKIMEALS